MSVMKKVVFICVCVATVISLCFIYFNRVSSLEGLAKVNVEALADATPCLREDCAHDYYSKEKSFVTDCKTCTRLMNYDGENDARCWVH